MIDINEQSRGGSVVESSEPLPETGAHLRLELLLRSHIACTATTGIQFSAQTVIRMIGRRTAGLATLQALASSRIRRFFHPTFESLGSTCALLEDVVQARAQLKVGDLQEFRGVAG
jgi:hypothetical protein